MTASASSGCKALRPAMRQIDFDAKEAPLVRLLRQRDVALFVGSGISRWSGLPSWCELLTGLAEKCRELGGSVNEAQAALSRNEMLVAASLLCDQMSASEIGSVLRRELKFGISRPHEIHELIFSLGVQRFVTTNYDDLLEQQASKSTTKIPFLVVTNRQLAELADIQKASADHFIFKPHGDLRDAESLILSDNHYQAIFADRDSPVKQALETIFVSRPILFIGYSLRDPDLQLILRELRTRYRGNAGDLWAILPDLSNDDQKRLWSDVHIRTISYDTSGQIYNDHSELLQILKRLRTAISQSSKNIPVSKSEADYQKEIILGLARYAARLVTPAVPSLPVRARLPFNYQNPDPDESLHHLDGRELDQILLKSTTDLVIEGPAGSGKSWCVTRAMSDSAQKILAHLADTTKEKADGLRILIRLDCQIYEGSFETLISLSIPPSLDLRGASQENEIVLVIDAIDEMPSRYLEDGSWRQDLSQLQSRFEIVRTIYLSRRRDLIPDSRLPCFRVDPLPDQVIEDALAEVSIGIKDISHVLLEHLRTPYALDMARRMLPRNRSLKTVLGMLKAFVDLGLSKLPAWYGRLDVSSVLADVAAASLIAGRETFALWDLSRRLGPSHERSVIDHLVEIGLLRSETQTRLRFPHRILTEYFTAVWISKHWRGTDFSLDNNVGARQLDNPFAWAAQMMTQRERDQFLDELLDRDYVVSCTLADTTEVDSTRIWIKVLDRIVARPPNFDLAFDLAYQLEDAEIPAEAEQKLRSLVTIRDSEISGWALSRLVPILNQNQIIEILENLVCGETSWNEWNWAGSALGQRIDAHLLNTLKDALVRSKHGDWDTEDQTRIDRSFAFESIIAGLGSAPLSDLLRWARHQRVDVRGVIIRGVAKLQSADAERFIVRQFDLGFPQAVFSLYLRLAYGQPAWCSPIPRPTQRRLNLLTVGLASAPRRELRWRLSLLRTLAEHNFCWCEVLEQRILRETNRDLKRILAALTPRRERQVLRRRIRQLLRRGLAPSAADGALFDALDHVDPSSLFSEADLRAAFDVHGWSVWQIVGVFLNGIRRKRQGKFLVSDADFWVEFSHAVKKYDTETASLDQIATFVAESLSRQARDRIIARANTPNDPYSTFILVELFRRMPTVTTDDLTPEAGLRLLISFLQHDYEGDPLPTPGSIATERYIREVVIPYVHDHGVSGIEDGMKRILMEAGERHGFRYRLSSYPF